MLVGLQLLPVLSSAADGWTILAWAVQRYCLGAVNGWLDSRAAHAGSCSSRAVSCTSRGPKGCGSIVCMQLFMFMWVAAGPACHCLEVVPLAPPTANSGSGLRSAYSSTSTAAEYNTVQKQSRSTLSDPPLISAAIICAAGDRVLPRLPTSACQGAVPRPWPQREGHLQRIQFPDLLQ